MPAPKYYFTRGIIEQIRVWTACKVVRRVADLEGLDLGPKWDRARINTAEDLNTYLLETSAEVRDAVNEQFRNIKAIARVPLIKPTIIQVMKEHGLVKNAHDEESDRRTLNTYPLATVAANIYCNMGTRVWQEICMVARQLSYAESRWQSFTIEPGEGAALHVSDDDQAQLRKAICNFIFNNEGRADEGWCSYYYDQGRDVHGFVIDMTDHLADHKEHTGHNKFTLKLSKGVFDILFRYKPSLKELSIRSDAPRGYKKEMCLIWTQIVFGGAAQLIDNRHRYSLQHLIDRETTDLAIPTNGSVKKASIRSLEIGSLIQPDYNFLVDCRRGKMKEMVSSLASLTNMSRCELAVKKVNIDFTYQKKDGDLAVDPRYFRPDATNAMRAPDAIKLEIPQILQLNGLTNDVA